MPCIRPCFFIFRSDLCGDRYKRAFALGLRSLRHGGHSSLLRLGTGVVGATPLLVPLSRRRTYLRGNIRGLLSPGRVIIPRRNSARRVGNSARRVGGEGDRKEMALNLVTLLPQ